MAFYYASPYTIHFDDTMAYGSHHFLTAFKFQCDSRETYLFGERIFDLPGVPETLDSVHLFTGEAYSRNLSPCILGDRVVTLLTLEEWGRISARFCYRVISEQGKAVCAGFQTLICADPETGNPIPVPKPLLDAMNSMREIEEPHANGSFRDQVLQGGDAVDRLFSDSAFATAKLFLSERYPKPGVIPAVPSPPSHPPSLIQSSAQIHSSPPTTPDQRTTLRRPETEPNKMLETWVFSGQGTFDANLLSQRVREIVQRRPATKQELDRCAAVASELIGGDALAVVSGELEACKQAVRQTPDLMQCAIHLQNVLGAQLLEHSGRRPDLLMGHSFGEIAALGVAGSFDLVTGIQIVCHRVIAINEHAPLDGELLVVSTDRQRVTSEAEILGLDQVVVAGRNHKTQTVASGPATQLKRLGDHFRNISVNAVKIASPTSFHHPNLREAGSNWLKRMSALPIGLPQRPVFTPIGRRFISETDNIPATLASQFTRPFDLQGAVCDVVAAGGGTFIDCGSTGTMQRMISNAGAANVIVTRATTQSPVQETKTHPEVGKSTQPTLDANRTLIPTIAIVGHGCLLPGGASSPNQLSAAIEQQRVGIVDQSKLDPHWLEDFYSEDLVPDRSTSPLSGLVNEEDIVVPDDIEPAIFADFTRTQKLLCIALAPCISSLRGVKRVLCLVGATADGFRDQDLTSSLRYAGLDPTDPEIDRRLQTARSASDDPHSAIQDVFDRIVRPGLKVTLVDAACASSLYTLALGMHALESNEADAVIAGGVFCPGPGNSCLFSQFRGTTATGCRPFDANADGVVFSEGAAMVVLRRLADAESSNSTVHAIVRGIGLSSDGKSSSANVPQTRGQILALQRCYSNYRIEPATVNAIEAHGTSTPVGDSTEIDTLREFFEGQVPKSIPVHSLKGLLGHSGWAAGTASIIATCEYLRSGMFPGQAFFCEPSKAVKNSRGTLHVTPAPSCLPQNDCRIAVDGFGFGGANAHVVIDRYSPGKTPTDILVSYRDDPQDNDSELVCVAVEQIHPTQVSPSGKRFDRESIAVPKHHLLLPDLADDMDVTQTLAISLTDQILSGLSRFNDSLRKQTSVVLALPGKTERGIEATLRILAKRFCRDLSGTQHVAKLSAAADSARPSGPYTLQCMMPNVSAGRASLQLNLNGPNFVVDAGEQSFAAALESARILLRSGDDGGNRLAIVAEINANIWQSHKLNGNNQGEEYAAAFGITTRRYANELGLAVIAPAHTLLPTDNPSVSKQTSEVVSAVVEPGTTNETASDDEFPVHTPVWIESPLSAGQRPERRSRAIVIVRGGIDTIKELNSRFADLADQFMIAVVGSGAIAVARQLNQNDLIAVDLSEQQSIDSALSSITNFKPDTIVALEILTSWDVEETLDNVRHNELCEFLFLSAQHLAPKLGQGGLELWGLFPGGYKEAIHPATGSAAGFLKATVREIPGCRVGIVSTRSLDLPTSLNHLKAEWSSKSREPEIVYDGYDRLIRRLRPTTQLSGGVCQVELTPESVVLATGGARGVTAVLIDALVRDYGCKVVAIGRSAIEKGPANAGSPDAEREFYQRYITEHPGQSPTSMKRSFEAANARWEAYQTIETLSSIGGGVHYIQADVTSADDVARVVQEVSQNFGRVDLLVHGAGVQYSKKLEDRTLEEFRLTYRVKVGGLHNMVQAIGKQFEKTVPAHVLTSAYSVFGNDGQHDYGAANETLDRLCGITKIHSDVNWSSIAWLAWDGIGMTRGTEYRALAKQRGLSGLTAIDGQRVFRDAFRGLTCAAINIPISVQEHVGYNLLTIPKSSSAGGKTRTREISVHLSEIPCLRYHVVKGVPTLPGAWTVERMVEASLPLATVENPVAACVTNLTLSRFVKLVNNAEPNIRVIAEQTECGIFVKVLGNVLHSSGAVLLQDVLFAEAQIEFLDRPIDLVPSLSGAKSSSPDNQFATALRDPYCKGGEVNLSGPFDCLRDLRINGEEREAKFVPCGQTNWPGRVPALLIDAGLRVGGMYPGGDPDALLVPIQIGKLMVPLSMNASSIGAAGWQIRATNPLVDGREVRWARTEVINSAGEIQLVVEDSIAHKM